MSQPIFIIASERIMMNFCNAVSCFACGCASSIVEASIWLPILLAVGTLTAAPAPPQSQPQIQQPHQMRCPPCVRNLRCSIDTDLPPRRDNRTASLAKSGICLSIRICTAPAATKKALISMKSVLQPRFMHFPKTQQAANPRYGPTHR